MSTQTTNEKATERKQFTVTIDAPREKVWNALWEDANYREWTAVFGAGSHAVSDWKKGSKILFLASEDRGMTSVISDLIPNEYMSFTHKGEVKDGVEDFTSAEAQGWANAQENYTLKTVNGKTELTVDMDISNEFADYFTGTFPKALALVKEIAERN
ncbi:MAG: Activator of Hsp90 ATPase 1 family protein [Flavipsychrobacter sp.]|jgi:uncharacterized protein YndB with AHSA1/START domain|nr:Activator of Hsp90 ATPase 1 family protein [Flavipsychrobacter sp.]